MAETPLHRKLTSNLDGYMRHCGVTVTHSTATPLLPDPYRIGAHEPDVIGHIADWLYISEAERGPELFDAHTQRQLRDFSRRRIAGWKRSTFFLYVPRSYADDAREAVIAAGGDITNTTIVVPKPVRIRRKPAQGSPIRLKQRGGQQSIAMLPQRRGRTGPVPRSALAALLRAQPPR